MRVDVRHLEVEVDARGVGRRLVLAEAEAGPILAAQQETYLAAQLQAFRARTRSEKDAHDFMWGIAGQLSPEAMRDLAHYYATQPPAPGRTGDPALVEAGKALFDRGLPDRGVPACAACHGPQGDGTEMFPRLAGQHADYIEKQLVVFQRTNERPEGAVMKTVAHLLTQDNIVAVANYLQGLPPKRD